MRHFIGFAFVTNIATSAAAQKMSYGLEVAFRSGHADRGFIAIGRGRARVVHDFTVAGQGGTPR